jgi:hypothetical protein
MLQDRSGRSGVTELHCSPNIDVAFQVKSNHKESGDESCSNPRNDGVRSFYRSDPNRHAGYRYGEVLWRVRWMVCKAFKGPSSVPTEVRSKALLLTRSCYARFSPFVSNDFNSDTLTSSSRADAQPPLIS